jgi:cell division transport system permease protein
MFWRKFFYCVKDAVRNVKGTLVTNLITIFTISLSSLVLSIFLLLSFNVKTLIHTFGDKIHVILYLDDDLSAFDLQQLIRDVSAFKEVLDLRYVSRDDALHDLKKILKNQDGILDNLSANPLPQSLEIQVKSEYHSSAEIEDLVKKLKKYKGVNDIEYGEDWLRKFTTIFSFLNLLGILIAGIIVLATIMIISNTIKLSIHSRCDEIEIMKLVGATDRFIKFPFFLEGLLQGVLGSLLSTGLLFLLYRLSLRWLAGHRFLELSFLSISFLPPDVLWIIIFSGAAIGAMGSLTSLAKFLKI